MEEDVNDSLDDYFMYVDEQGNFMCFIHENETEEIADFFVHMEKGAIEIEAILSEKED